MSSTNGLGSNEDLENITLVRMEDVQPDRNCELYEVLNISPYIMNRVIDHDYICVARDEDSNIGNTVSIHLDDVEDSNEKIEFIDHDVLTPVENKTMQFVTSKQDSWPTLEILPGGVIKHSEKMVTNINQITANNTDDGDMMYACAKCPMKFKFLFNLVRHVKLHEDQQKKQKLSKSNVERNVPRKLKNSSTQTKNYKIKCKVPKKG